MINDGFGDQPGYDETEQMLRDEEAFFVRNARSTLLKKNQRGFKPGEDDDAVQEARIAAWQSYIEHHNPRYMNIAVRQRLIAHVMRDQWFGTKPTAHEMDPIRRSGRDSLDDPDLDLILLAEENIEALTMAYHHGQIMEALNVLSPKQREFVYMRFWEGRTYTDIAARLGLTEGGAKSVWLKQVRPLLAHQLAHLGT